MDTSEDAIDGLVREIGSSLNAYGFYYEDSGTVCSAYGRPAVSTSIVAAIDVESGDLCILIDASPALSATAGRMHPTLASLSICNYAKRCRRIAAFCAAIK